MSGIPGNRDQGADRPVPQPQDNTPSPLAAAGKRSRLKGIVAPLVLAVLGLALLVGAFLLYPSTTESSTPAFTQVTIGADSKLNAVEYKVIQRQGVAEVQISLEPYGRLPSGGAAAGLVVEPPIGTAFVDCPKSHCRKGVWTTGMLLTSDKRSTTAKFRVKASNFGVTSNGVTAAAAIPVIYLHGPVGDLVTFYTDYSLPSASSYDWSSYPTYTVSRSAAVWDETLDPGNTAGRTVVGINHVAQADDDTRTFIAGALLGLAGAAILAAVIEALHVRDWAEFRALRSK
jgi:hypothetical protein